MYSSCLCLHPFLFKFSVFADCYIVTGLKAQKEDNEAPAPNGPSRGKQMQKPMSREGAGPGSRCGGVRL
jgi:hypothetical protein